MIFSAVAIAVLAATTLNGGDTGREEQLGRIPNGVAPSPDDAAASGAPGSTEGFTDQYDPARFRVVEDGVVEDAATGIRRHVDKVKKDDPAPVSAQVIAQILGMSTDRTADLRNGAGPRPIRLRVGSIGVDADVFPIGLDDNGALAVPRRADVTGWWSGGYAPGEAGPTVIVGHFDSQVAPGVFARLKDIAEGEEIKVDQSDGSSYRYEVILVERLEKTAFPTTKVYGETDRSTLRLVTCGGKFDRRTRHYVDNVIAYAELRSIQSAPFIIPPGILQPDMLNDIFGPAVGIPRPGRPAPVDPSVATGLASTLDSSTTRVNAPSTPGTSTPGTSNPGTTNPGTTTPSAPSIPGVAKADKDTADDRTGATGSSVASTTTTTADE